MHTQRSDGLYSYEDALKRYKSCGYDFVAVTDHWAKDGAGCREGLLCLSGVEFDTSKNRETVHIVGIGFERDPMALVGRGASAQSLVDAINQSGGRAILCHPAWSLNSPATIASLKGLTATEIYNTFSGCPWGCERADASSLIDAALASGFKTNLVASDDSHYYDGEDCVSYVKVQSRNLTAKGILDGLDAGEFYATQGPDFVQIEYKDGEISVECSPCDMVYFASNVCWTPDRCRAGRDIVSVKYRVAQGERYVRVVLRDAYGRKAWSNPVYM